MKLLFLQKPANPQTISMHERMPKKMCMHCVLVRVHELYNNAAMVIEPK